jgi:hypothetical protein
MKNLAFLENVGKNSKHVLFLAFCETSGAWV